MNDSQALILIYVQGGVYSTDDLDALVAYASSRDTRDH